MTDRYQVCPLGRVVRDLTAERITEVAPNDEVVDPTIESRTHKIKVASIQKGGSVRITKRVRILSGDLVFSRLHTQNGAFAFADRSFLSTTTFLPLAIDETQIEKGYLFWALHMCVPTLSTSDTVGRETYKTEDILSLEIPSPPLDEQRRVVARIEQLAAKVEEVRGLRRGAAEDAEKLVASEISSLFSKGERNRWVSGKLGDYVVDAAYGTSEKTNDDNSGTPVLRMGNIQNGRLDLRDLKYLHLSERERATLLLAEGDILVNRTNSAELVGKCAVFDANEEHSFASYLIRLRLDRRRAEPRLVAAFINSPSGRAYMFSERKQMTGQANVNATKLKALPICLPPLPEQRRIVAYLDGLQAKVDALKRLQAETAAELDALLPSILDRAFRGEL